MGRVTSERRRFIHGVTSLMTTHLTTACFQRKSERQDSSTAPATPLAKPGPLDSSNTQSSGATELATTTHEHSSAFGQLETVYLQPLGDGVAESELTFIEAALALYFPFAIKRLPTVPLPKDAYYATRARYRAERLLKHLERLTPPDAQVVVGLTEVDISTTKGDIYDWGVLGLATLSGKQCVISRFRAQRDALSPLHVRERLTKTVVHEVGHTIGLPHCPNYGCIMEDGKGSVTTTDHEHDVCAQCRARVGDLMLPPPVHLPW